MSVGMPPPAKQWLRRVALAAAVPYRPAGHYAWRFARGKLAGDPAFAGLLQRGLIPAGARILDLGCGMGLLAAWLRAALALHAAGDWPAGWPAPPGAVRMRGIELRARDVTLARAALGRSADPACAFEQGDIRSADFGRADAVVILDVLHYLDPAAQDAVLARVRAALTAGGVLLLRVGDAGTGLRYRFSAWVDRLVARARGQHGMRLHGRPLAAWVGALQTLGFAVDAIPMSAGTLFANVLLVGRVAAPVAAASPQGAGCR